MIETSKVTLRAQTSDDDDFLLQLYISTREAELIQIGWTSAQIQPFLEQQFVAQHQSYRQAYADADFQIIEYQGEAAGRLYLHRGKDEYRIIDIVLVPELRNRKLGCHLIENIQASARENSLPVCLYVEPLNPAIRLYQRLGFEKQGTGGIHIFMCWAPAPGAAIE